MLNLEFFFLFRFIFKEIELLSRVCEVDDFTIVAIWMNIFINLQIDLFMNGGNAIPFLRFLPSIVSACELLDEIFSIH
jgi:predicted membrane protein